MREKNIKEGDESRVAWDSLEACARERVRSWLQDLLEEEVTELLGRKKSERRQGVDGPEGYRNGYGKPRRITMSSGTIEVRRPRVRGLEERFESKLLPLFARRTKEVDALLPELYLHGLSLGDFDLALRGLLGENAPISPSVVARLKEKWSSEFLEWSERSLEGLQVVYLWVDGIYVKAGLEKEKAAVLVAVVGLSDGNKEIVALRAGVRESQESWSELLRDLKARGMNCPRYVVGDGHLGIWAGLRNVYPDVEEGRCWNHKIINVLDKVPKKHQAQATFLLKQIPVADSEEKAEQQKRKFIEWCEKKQLDDAVRTIDRDWERMLSFYQFPKEHWQHLRTTNVIESPFAALRLRTDAAKRFRKVENATAIIFKMLCVAQSRFRRLNAPHLLGEVFAGATFKDGVRVRGDEEAAA